MSNARYSNRTEIATFLNPINGYRGKLESQGKQVKNHMKENRMKLKQATDAAIQKREIDSQQGPDPFKMRKFQGIQSKVMNELQHQSAIDDIKPLAGRAQTRGGIVRPGSANRVQPIQKKAVFGRSYSNVNRQGAEIGAQMSSSRIQSQSGLNKNALAQLNHRTKGENKMYDVDKKINIPINNENEDTINMQRGTPMLPPKTPNYGKTPKYIEEYKQVAKQKEDDRMEAKAASKRPPGTRVLPEEERIATLESLYANKKDVSKILNQMPISMRTENLRRQKIELEQKLVEIDKAVEMFSRKLVFVREE